MSDSNNTSAIDEKKSNSEGGTSNKDPNYGKFLSSLLIILFVFIYFSFSGFILYACKIAQSNVLPTDKNCYPYTDIKPENYLLMGTTQIQNDILKWTLKYPLQDKIKKLNTMKKFDEENFYNIITDPVYKYLKELSKKFELIQYYRFISN